MSQLITCRSISVYALTRGRQYVLLAHDRVKKQVKVRADSGRSRWFRSYLFNMDGGPVPVLRSWRFWDPVIDPLNGCDETSNWMDVTVTLDDGTERHCQMTTPRYLQKLMDNPHSDPVIYSRTLLIVRDLTEATVNRALRELDNHDQLAEHSLLIEPFDDAPEINEEDPAAEVA